MAKFASSLSSIQSNKAVVATDQEEDDFKAVAKSFISVAARLVNHGNVENHAEIKSINDRMDGVESKLGTVVADVNRVTTQLDDVHQLLATLVARGGVWRHDGLLYDEWERDRRTCSWDYRQDHAYVHFPGLFGHFPRCIHTVLHSLVSARFSLSCCSFPLYHGQIIH